MARAGGAGGGFVKLNLEPGWRLMRRHYVKRALSHLYVFRAVWHGRELQPAVSAPLESDLPS